MFKHNDIDCKSDHAIHKELNRKTDRVFSTIYTDENEIKVLESKDTRRSDKELAGFTYNAKLMASLLNQTKKQRRGDDGKFIEEGKRKKRRK